MGIPYEHSEAKIIDELEAEVDRLREEAVVLRTCWREDSDAQHASRVALSDENERLREAMQAVLDRGIKCDACGHVQHKPE